MGVGGGMSNSEVKTQGYSDQSRSQYVPTKQHHDENHDENDTTSLFFLPNP